MVVALLVLAPLMAFDISVGEEYGGEEGTGEGKGDQNNEEKTEDEGALAVSL